VTHSLELSHLCCLQGLNVSPTLIVIGPYDTTVAGQVGLSSLLIASLCFRLLLGRALSWHVLGNFRS
jgi:hypothetical protein